MGKSRKNRRRLKAPAAQAARSSLRPRSRLSAASLAPPPPSDPSQPPRPSNPPRGDDAIVTVRYLIPDTAGGAGEGEQVLAPQSDYPDGAAIPRPAPIPAEAREAPDPAVTSLSAEPQGEPAQEASPGRRNPRSSQPPVGHPSQPPAASPMPADVTDHELQLLSADFFERATSEMPHVEWHDDYDRPVMSHGSRRAMYASVALLGISMAAIGGYLVYHKLIMPTPVQLGGATAYQLPTPRAEQPTHVPEPAEAASLRAHGEVAMAEPSTPASAPDSAPAVPEPRRDTPASAELLVGTGADAPSAGGSGAPVTTDEVSPAPPDPSLEADDGFAQLLADAVAQNDAGHARDALPLLQQARTLRPIDAGVLTELAFAHLNLGNRDEAARHAEQAVAVDPTRSKAWIVLGAARDAARDHGGARQAYERCAALDMDQYVRECQRLLR